MRDIDQIDSILSEYENLKKLVEHQLEILVKIDSNKFYTGRCIENIFFNKYKQNVVEIEYDDGQSSLWYEYPLHYLTLSDKELVQVCQNDFNQQIENEQIVREQTSLNNRLERERTELEMYNMLKAKYEN